MAGTIPRRRHLLENTTLFQCVAELPYAHPYIYPYIRLSDDAAGRWHLTPEGKSVMLLLADQILDKAIRA